MKRSLLLLLLVIVGIACSHDEPVGPDEFANAPGFARRPGDPPLGPPVFPPKSPPVWTGAPTTLTIAKIADPTDGNVASDDPFSFDVTVANTGGQTATGVFLTDDLPDFTSSWTFEQITGEVTVTCLNLGNTFLCGIYRAGPNGETDFAGVDMAPGQSYTVRFTAANDQDDCGSVTNTASVVAGNAPEVSASASVTVVCPPPPPQANLEIVKTESTDQPVGFGDPFWFDVTVTNTGDATAIRALLTDDLPDFASNWSAEVVGEDGPICFQFGSQFLCGMFVPGPDPDTYDFAGVDLIPGQSYTVRFTAANDQGDCGTATNTASVAAENVPRVEDSGSVTVICPPE